MNRIKICGLKRMEDILAVNEYKPEYIGFVFANTKRFVSDELAAELKDALDKEIKAAGVFANEPIAHVVKLVSEGTIDAIQLHGQEDLNYVNQLKEELIKISESPHISGQPGIGKSSKENGKRDRDREKKQFNIPIIKAVQIDASLEVTEAKEAEIRKENRKLIDEAKALQVDYLLFDAKVKGILGGSGKQFDIAGLPPDKAIGMPYFLAGGIGLHNVKQLIALRNPYGIDVSSAVETDGYKDKEKIKEFIETVRKELK